jgi:hypothetical protein
MRQQDSRGMPLADRWLMKSLKPTRETGGASLGRGGLLHLAGSGNGRLMPRWVIPMLYTLASVTAGLILPRLEHVYFARAAALQEDRQGLGLSRRQPAGSSRAASEYDD